MFPAPLIEEAVFSPLYIPASFVEDKGPIGVWIWGGGGGAFYFAPLNGISVFVPVPYYLDY